MQVPHIRLGFAQSRLPPPVDFESSLDCLVQCKHCESSYYCIVQETMGRKEVCDQQRWPSSLSFLVLIKTSDVELRGTEEQVRSGVEGLTGTIGISHFHC